MAAVTPLVTTTAAGANIDGFSALDAGVQASLCASATGAINRYCGRVLASTVHDEIHEPTNTRVVRLRQYPVSSVGRLCAGLTAVLTIKNTNASASRAWASYSTTGEEESQVFTGLNLDAVVNGVRASTLNFLWPTYPTIGQLATAVNGAGSGWSATVGGTSSNWATIDLNPDLGSWTALNAGCPLWAFVRDLYRYDVKRSTGEISIFEDLPRSHRYPDQMWTGSGRAGSVRAIYTAGYIVTPDDLAQACFQLIKAMMEQKGQAGPLVLDRQGQDQQQYAVLGSVADGLIGLVAGQLKNYRRRSVM